MRLVSLTCAALLAFSLLAASSPVFAQAQTKTEAKATRPGGQIVIEVALQMPDEALARLCVRWQQEEPRLLERFAGMARRFDPNGDRPLSDLEDSDLVPFVQAMALGAFEFRLSVACAELAYRLGRAR